MVWENLDQISVLYFFCQNLMDFGLILTLLLFFSVTNLSTIVFSITDNFSKYSIILYTNDLDL